MVIKHYYNPQHNKSRWGWEEKFSLEAVCTPESPDIIEQARKLIDEWGCKKGWDCHHLYTELKSDAISVEFRCIVFEEFSMKRGDSIYLVAEDELYNRMMTEKYGPDWKTTWKEIDREKKRKELEENKRK